MLKQFGIKSVIVGPWKWMRSDANEHGVIVGAGVRLIHRPTISCGSDTHDYRSYCPRTLVA